MSETDAPGPVEVPPLEGYRYWARDYDRILSGNCENPILERCGIDWGGKAVLDIGCGTGRTAAWIRSRAPDATLDGIDFCDEMLAQARAKHLYRRIAIGDILGGVAPPAPGYDLAVCVLVANHLDALAPLHRLASDAIRPGGEFLLIEYHPFMVLARREVAMQAPDGRAVVIRNRRHLLSDFLRSGLEQGLRLIGCWESEVTAAWVERAPSLAPFLGKPVGLGLRWRKETTAS
jgi:SAM-dependent methyltransferase